MEILFALGALTDKGELSPVGRQMSQFPLDPVYSKILLESQKYECTHKVIGLISMLSVDPVFFAPRDRREEANEARKKFATFDGNV